MSDNATNKRSVIAFTQYFEGEQKFDYFITSVAGILCAFIAERYNPRPFGPNSETIELIAILFLILSFFFGLKRIELLTTARRLNAKFLDHLEKYDFNKNTALFLDGGEELNEETVDSVYGLPSDRAKTHKNEAKRLRKEINAIKDKAKSAYEKRSTYLILGFFVLLLSKIIEAYTA